MAQPQAPASPFRDFGIRFLSAAVMSPVAVAAIWLGGLYFDGLVILLALFLGWETARLSGFHTNPVLQLILIALISVPVLTAAIYGTKAGIIALAITTVAAMAATFVRSRKLGMLIPSLVAYISFSCVAALWLRAQPDGWTYWVLILIVVIGTDIGAYLTGRTVGGPKLAPRISPGKTWSGAAGAVALSTVLVLGYAYGFGIAPVFAIAIAVALSVAAQLGDLFESWLKRDAGVKDSSNIIPGHGGVFDRLDGFLAVIPLLACFQFFFPLS